jgi:hypothetical protein
MNKSWNNSRNRKNKKRIMVTREDVILATEDYLKRGGEITKITTFDLSNTEDELDEAHQFLLGD